MNRGSLSERSEDGPSAAGGTTNAVRGQLACIPCRQRKVRPGCENRPQRSVLTEAFEQTRCPGPVDNDHSQPCGRCSRLSLRCHWQERRATRNGKRQRSASTSNVGMDRSPPVVLHKSRKSMDGGRLEDFPERAPALRNSPMTTAAEVQELVSLYFRSIHCEASILLSSRRHMLTSR